MNTNNLQILTEKAEPYVNTLVLYRFEVVRLAGVMDGEVGYFWVFEKDPTGLLYGSCHFSWMPLKGVLPEYEELLRVWNLNHKRQAI